VYSDSDLEAHESSVSLQEHIEQQVEDDSDMKTRLEQLEIPTGADTSLDSSQESNESSDKHYPINEIPPLTISSSSIDPTIESTPEPKSPAENDFEVVLSTTRVYSRVEGREIDAVSTVSTQRSRAWSVLSGISLTKISIIAVVKLPLYDSELSRFWNLASPSAMDTTTTLVESNTSIDLTEIQEEPSSSPKRAIGQSIGATATADSKPRFGGGVLGRLRKELWDIDHDPPSSCAAGPMGDNLVFLPSCLRNFIQLTNDSFFGRELSWAL
jgi:hypothetical protein